MKCTNVLVFKDLAQIVCQSMGSHLGNPGENELFAVLASICRELDCPAHKIGGTDDHVHVCCSLSRTFEVSKLVGTLKSNSSTWIKTKGKRYEGFAWQKGYGAFSIGQSQLDALRHYIATQREHHKETTFQDEFRELLKKYLVEFDERYVWD